MKLLLASQSSSRAALLKQAHIPFTLISQTANEHECDWSLPIKEVVSSIARFKMAHVVMPEAPEGGIAYVLTADTLTSDMRGNIYGKPTDYESAVDILKALQSGSLVATAFVLHKKKYVNGSWTVVDEYICVDEAFCDFIVPDLWIERYMQNEPLALKAAGAMAIEGYGAQFVRTIKGSYSTIMGLPLFELRCALEKLGFFDAL